MYARTAKRVRGRDPIRMNRSMVGIPFLGARNPHCPEYPLVGIPDSGDSGYIPISLYKNSQYGFAFTCRLRL